MSKVSTYLLPCPHWPERVEEAHVLEEVGVEPETRGYGEHCDEEEDESEDCHCEEETQETQTCH